MNKSRLNERSYQHFFMQHSINTENIYKRKMC